MSKIYYGDKNRWFVGIVVDTNDPLKLDRVKVRIQGIHTSDTTLIPNDDLPWAQVVIPVTEGGSSGIGANSSLKPRAQVYGIFLDGSDSQLPLVLGSIPKIESPVNETTSNITEKYPSGTTNVELNFSGKSNIEKCINFFISPAGGNYTLKQACGIVGNFCVESSPTVDPRALNESEGSIGIAQWNPATGRTARLIDYSNNVLKLNHLSLEAQLLYTKYELETFSHLGDAELRQTDTIKKATEAFMRNFEIPQGVGVVEGQRVILDRKPNRIDKRISYAIEIHRKIGSGDIGAA
mgnify:FL=1